MDTIWIILGVLALLIVLLYRPYRENMTNKDLLEALSKFGEHGVTKKKKDTESVQPIYGPKTEKVEEPTPISGKTKSNVDDHMIYPDIYGPEITPIPGKKMPKHKPGQTVSDDPEGDAYEFNPDLKKAFPTDGDEPQPFLTDFSKFQH